MLSQAFYDSGIIQTKADDEYTAMYGLGEGIQPENIKWWLDSGKPFHFEQDPITGSYAWIETQQDGSETTLGYSQEGPVDNYTSSLAQSSKQNYEDLYYNLTGHTVEEGLQKQGRGR